MKGRFDDFWDDFCKDIEADAPKPEPAPAVDLNKLGEQMEAAVKKAFESAKNEPAPKQEEPKKAEEPAPKQEESKEDPLEGNKEDM